MRQRPILIATAKQLTLNTHTHMLPARTSPFRRAYEEHILIYIKPVLAPDDPL
jgi:hypothetical protein